LTHGFYLTLMLSIILAFSGCSDEIELPGSLPVAVSKYDISAGTYQTMTWTPVELYVSGESTPMANSDTGTVGECD